MLWLYLNAETPLPEGALRVLHFAPEIALERPLRDAAGEYVSADLFSPRAEVKADITDLPFEDGRFDLVLCSHVLEHVADDAAAMSEMGRVLADGGTVVVQTPVNYDMATTFEDPSVTDPAERLRLFSQDDHVRVYGRDLVDRLGGAGFEVTVSEYAYDLPDGSIERYGLVPRPDPLRNDLYVCRRAA
ncbi:MAG TPA: methyltransferase domain-containing protein [Thermoleophilaceae bacterium]|nr:methyltransferase domain-containing protein [Thermoleophilaceae bacterium]